MACLSASQAVSLRVSLVISVSPHVGRHGAGLTRLDIKKAVTCLLMGGSKKILPDGMRLRGDINVLLLGDPGTAKSQLLKFVEKVSPVSVYTSGKGSSAAGLTASVQRDAVSVGPVHPDGQTCLTFAARVLPRGRRHGPCRRRCRVYRRV